MFPRFPFVFHFFWVVLQEFVYQMFAPSHLPVNCLPLPPSLSPTYHGYFILPYYLWNFHAYMNSLCACIKFNVFPANLLSAI